MSRRKKELLQMRDEHILRRYLYWTESQRLRFDDTIKRLSEQEFFMTEEYIIQIVRKELAKAASNGECIPRQKYLSVNLD